MMLQTRPGVQMEEAGRGVSRYCVLL